ncbi:type II secretion system minor pseudopilin GspK [Sphingomonas sp. SUN039]|uniref:type II secretion system minor pseudopilin GspK n=1 Tax=Sphingomonas sp. SUN039 TaxID=2937787 RepID=UPI002164213F|nr:type II secretion system minor pseudopilin GspK [Sphingomonas sp. SUN039]UVO53914.1 type II secretion system minor pseudopilin GspK [Sphingomonas sp. SUN039]
MRRPPDHEEGAALLTVLLIVAVMAVLAAAALERLKIGTRLTANGGGIEQARAYAMAAETVARYRIGDLIQRDAAKTTLAGNWAGQPTNFPIDGGTALARIDDGGNCFNLNSLVDKAQDGVLTVRPFAVTQFARLMTLLDVPGRDADSLADATADWIDSDAIPLAGGAEDAAYANARVAYLPANTLMADTSEWRAVAGVTPALYARLRPYVCALPVTDLTTINVNTLRREQAPLLAAVVPTLDTARAAAVVEARPEAGWDSLATFWSLPQLAASAADGGRGQVKLATRWFDLTLMVELEGADLEEHALIDAALKPAKIARRSYGEPS